YRGSHSTTNQRTMKYFNSYTMLGRRNCVLATYGFLGATLAVLLTQHSLLRPTCSKAFTNVP
uniref:Uncharacterized protein n=1 Tax=Stegastes partitus TaxID=144197 RepID=A0A3B5A7W5_9TELE